DLILPNGGTPAGTSSPASSSSLLNRLQLDDDIDGETRDLFVTVDDPKKHVCTMETYITYRITTKVGPFLSSAHMCYSSLTLILFHSPHLQSTRVEFDLPEYSVRRRYQDFDWLRNKLEESQPTHLIPPLPEKFVVKGVVDRFSEEFVETRRKALDKFLKRITDHPVLSFNEHFHVFLTAKDLNAYKKQGMALLTRVGESVKHVTGGYKLRSRPLEFAAVGEYLDTFALKLGTIDRIAQRIIKEEIEYLVELREYGPVYSTWSALEGELAEPLEGVSACIGNCSAALEELTDDMTEDFLPVLREYILYSDSMKSVLKKRDQVQAEYEAKLEAVAVRKEERPKVRAAACRGRAAPGGQRVVPTCCCPVNP
ncbi:Sorting nexin-30, partial [Camelus dromedarius]